MENKNLKIAIIGYGRFGKLLSQILSPYAEINILSQRKIEEKNIKQIDYKDLKEIDWIIPSVPISALKETLEQIKPNISPNSLVIDVCSVKVLPCQWLQEIMPKEIQILGTHPMFGPDSAKNGLEGLQMVLCPLRISEENLKTIKDIFNDLKLKIIKTTPEDHDEQAAISLAMVHFIGRALGKMDIKKQEITTLGFERLLAVNETVNNDTWQLFLDMHNYNPYTEKIRQELINALTNLHNEIKTTTQEEKNA